MPDNDMAFLGDPDQLISPAIRRMEEALVALHRAVAISQFYPNSNPVMREALEAAYGALIDVDDDERLRTEGIVVDGPGLTIAGEPIGAGSPAIGYLARLLSRHGVACMRRSSELTANGVEALVSFLAIAPDIMVKKGGAVAVWARINTPHVFDFDFIVGPKPGGRRRKRTQQGWSGDWSEPLTSDDEGASALSNPTLVSRLKSFQQRGTREKELVYLLLRLGSSRDERQLGSTLDRITRTAIEYLDEQQYRPNFQIAMVLYREARNYQALGDRESAEKIFDAIRLMLDGPFVNWLTQAVATSSGYEEAEIGEYLLKLVGGDAVVYVINALAAERTRLGRRRLVSVLVSIGAAVEPFAVRMLEDQRWYVVRNMIAVLAGIGGPSLIGHLRRLKDDPDVRIQKEVIRALGKVGTVEAQNNLAPYVEHPDASVRRMAVEALSNYGTESALELLMGVYAKIPLKSDEWDVKVAAIEGLGRFAQEKSVDLLGAILKRKVWFRRQRHERLQLAAVLALGEIGSGAAIHILDGVQIRHASPDVRVAAARALAAAGHG